MRHLAEFFLHEIRTKVEDLQDLRVVPGNRLEKLKGDRAGQYSIRINDQWRICFEWVEQKARNVEIAGLETRPALGGQAVWPAAGCSTVLTGISSAFGSQWLWGMRGKASGKLFLQCL
ncbi:MAG: type II toxin-antitoxin system RelE/ParE family toxin [Armatimonadetes bacterium]|nr:type II toxin-antitoxin system RelE/ParE family toxin [Armatimonadota bacterium]